ncbi:MAG: helix-hairpin-helix domain-containing protein, partial [Phycisphaerales bacterium]
DGIGVVHHSYAVELFKPYFEDRDPETGQWQLVIKTAGADDVVQPIEWSGLRRFHVLLAEDPVAELFDDGDFEDPEEPTDAATRYNYERSYSNPTAQVLDPQRFTFAEGSSFDLQRLVSRTGEWLTVDYVRVARDGWMAPDQGPRSTQRDISLHKCRRRLWTPTGVTPVVLGHSSGQYVDPNDERLIQAHPINRTLRNIGELGMVFADSAYGVMPDDTAEQVLLDLMNPAYAELFNYLMVLDPTEHILPPAPGLPPNPNEMRIMGRININTAPWFVLAQLPWIQYQDTHEAKSTRARAIVDYRNGNGPFENIAGLMQVAALRDLADDGLDNLNDETPRGPDLTRDSARDDLEERDLLFTRLSNLVTVRSDVFTAYILVRLGVNGPQKRMMAILDRSRTSDQNRAVRVVALHPVADPR